MKPSNQINSQIIRKAKAFSKHFTITQRETGSEFHALDKTAPQALKDLVREVHGEFLPDDFRYEVIHSALIAFAECGPDDLDEVRVEADIYSPDLTGWLGSNLRRIAYCDEAQADLGLETVDVMTLIAYGQQKEKDEIVSLVREALMSLCT